jgi:hypothetical protein
VKGQRLIEIQLRINNWIESGCWKKRERATIRQAIKEQSFAAQA